MYVIHDDKSRLCYEFNKRKRLSFRSFMPEVDIRMSALLNDGSMNWAEKEHQLNMTLAYMLEGCHLEIYFAVDWTLFINEVLLDSLPWTKFSC